MRGVDYSNTSYRRMYKPTAAFKLLGCEAQCVYWALRQVLNPAGYFELDGAKASEALAVEVGWTLDDLDFIERGLERLLDRGWIFHRQDEDDALHEPDFYEAEHASKSGKLRTWECRQRKKTFEDPEAPKVAQGPRPVPSKPRAEPKPKKSTAPVIAPRPLRAVATVEREPAERKRPIGFQLANAEEDVPSSSSSDSASQVAVPEMPPRHVGEPEVYGFELVDWPPEPSVTNCYSPVTNRFAGVTNSPSQYPVPNTQYPKQAASESGSVCARESPRCDAGRLQVAELAAAEVERVKKNPVGRDGGSAAGDHPPSTRESPPPRPPDADAKFQSFARQVETSFGSINSSRLLNPGEAGLIREWFDLGIDPGLIDETLATKAGAASKPVRSLLYFREPVREAWLRHRELVACHPPDAPPLPALDFGQRLDGLVAAIPLEVPDRERLVEAITKLRGRVSDPEKVEDRLREIERRYLDRIDLSPDQDRTLEQSLAFLTRTVPRQALSEHRKRFANQLKREGLGLPVLTLLSDETQKHQTSR